MAEPGKLNARKGKIRRIRRGKMGEKPLKFQRFRIFPQNFQRLFQFLIRAQPHAAHARVQLDMHPRPFPGSRCRPGDLF